MGIFWEEKSNGVVIKTLLENKISFDGFVNKFLLSLILFNFLNLKEISLKNILMMALLSSLLNSLFQSLYLQISMINLDPYLIFSYLIGDLLGCLVIFYLVKYIKNLYISFSSKK